MEKISQKLQFVIILSVFLPVVIDALFKDDMAGGKDMTLMWGVVIGVLIANYLLIELIQKIDDSIQKVINWFLFANIFAFIPVLFILGANIDGVIEFPYTLIYPVSLQLLFWIPIGIFGILVVMPAALNLYREHKQNLTDGLYKKIWLKIKSVF